MKAIRLSAHAKGYLAKRGFTPSEVEEAIREAPWEPALRGKLECRKDFAFKSFWNGAWYDTKQVRPIFADDPQEIVVITVYTYYF